MARVKMPYPMFKIMKIGSEVQLTYTKKEGGPPMETKGKVVGLLDDGMVLEVPDNCTDDGSGPDFRFTLGSGTPQN